jgi:hypothetical protein
MVAPYKVSALSQQDCAMIAVTGAVIVDRLDAKTVRPLRREPYGLQLSAENRARVSSFIG